MPYKTIAEAKTAGFPTHAEDIALTIDQINKLADIYDAIKKEGTVDIPMAAAWTAWKKIYVKKGDKWVTKEGGATAEKAGSWINVAKKGQTKKLLDSKKKIYKKITLTEVGLRNSAASFKGKDIIINHRVAINEPKILDARYTSPFLQMFFDEEATKLFRDTDSTGWSVQYDPDSLVFDGDEIIDGVGVGIGLLYGDHIPVCTPEMGCQEQSYTFETYTDFNTTDTTDEGLRKEAERIWPYIKSIFGSKKNKKEEEDQENNKKNLDKKSKMETEEKLTLELKTANDKLTKMESEFETAKTGHTEEVKELKDKVAAFEKEKEDARTAKIDSDWEQLKKTVIPVGLVHKEDDEKKLKVEFEQSPHEFIMKMAEFEKHKETKEEGAEFETDPDEVEKIIEAAHKEAGIGFEVR